jgi:DUF4097 and DUF4098 domain-containing protein YvlB
MWFVMTAAEAAAPVDQERPGGDKLQVEISVPCGSLTVTGSEQPSVKVAGTVDRPEALDVSTGAGAVSIEVAPPSCARLSVRLPRAATLAVETISASVTVSAMTGSVDLESVSGAITADTRGPELDCETISGAIHARGALQRTRLATVSGSVFADELAGSIELETVSGPIRVSSGAPLNALRAESVSGPVTAAVALHPSAKVELASHSGPIVLAIPSSSQVTVHAETVSGRIVSAFGATGGRELGVTLGDGSGLLLLETFSGPITLSRLEP